MGKQVGKAIWVRKILMDVIFLLKLLDKKKIRALLFQNSLK